MRQTAVTCKLEKTLMTELEIDKILNKFKSNIGNDFTAYRNHVIRTVKLTLLLKRESNVEDELKLIIAGVFHDIGLWTENTFDYLNPSINLAKIYLKKIERSDWSEEVGLIIEMHHKRSTYKGKYIDNVESFRKADLIDITKGRKNFGINKKFIEDLYKDYPMSGFRKMLFLKFLKNLLKNPFNPLPMFKK